MQVVQHHQHPAAGAGRAQRLDDVVEYPKSAGVANRGRISDQVDDAPTERADDLRPRPVGRRPLPFQTRTPGHNKALIAGPARQLGGQRRLPHPGFTLAEDYRTSGGLGSRQAAL
jgi:hypothetical protein